MPDQEPQPKSRPAPKPARPAARAPAANKTAADKADAADEADEADKGAGAEEEPKPGPHEGPDENADPADRQQHEPAPGAAAPSSMPAFSLGWLMADLYANALQRPPTAPDYLPTLTRLSQPVKRELERQQLVNHLPKVVQEISLVAQLAADPAPPSPLGSAGGATAAALLDLNQTILQQLSLTNQVELAAYQLGRGLRDTCWLPTVARGPEFFLHELGRDRLAHLQAWLNQAGSNSALPAEAANVVSRSIDSWHAWADVNAPNLRANWGSHGPAVIAALRQQSHNWQGLLSGDMTVPANPSSEAWMLAGESMLRSAGHLTWQVLRRFWWLAIIFVILLVGALWLDFHNTKGNSTVWSTLVTIGGAVGITGTSIRAGAKKATGTFEDAVKHAAEADAKAWQITWLPLVRQTAVQTLRLSSQGVRAPRTGMRMEYPVHQTAPAPPITGPPPGFPPTPSGQPGPPPHPGPTAPADSAPPGQAIPAGPAQPPQPAPGAEAQPAPVEPVDPPADPTS